MIDKYEKPWVAALYDIDGYTVERDDFVREYDLDGNEFLDELDRIVLVKGNARPDYTGSGVYRSPDSYRTLDLVAEREVSSYDYDEILEILDEFNEIADLLNSAGSEKGADQE